MVFPFSIDELTLRIARILADFLEEQEAQYDPDDEKEGQANG